MWASRATQQEVITPKDFVPSMPDLKAQLDQFSMQVAMTVQQLAKQMGRLEQRLDALAATAGLSWQSGWAPHPPESKSNGKSKATVPPWAFSGDSAPKVDEGLAGKGGLYL